MSATADAKEFVRRWKGILSAVPEGKNNEQQDTAKFWQDLLVNVLGVPSSSVATFVDFERKVRGRRIDVFVSDHHFLCEQKSVGVDLDKPEPRQGRMETPYQQAIWYAQHLPYSERPRWLMTCNFETFRLYDLDEERPEDGMQEFTLDELPDYVHMLSFLTSKETSRLHKEQQLSIEAGGYVSKLYDALSKQYHHIDGDDETAREEQRSLNVLITRIIFMLYAEDADLLQSHSAFGDFCRRDPHKLRGRLMELFRVIDTPVTERDEYMDGELAAFPYVNGGLFSDSSIVIPQMTDEIAQAIVDASEGFMWRDISGVIFGGVFEGTLNPETRHAGGMHYTSVENIERCLKPLFLDELWDELHRAEGERSNAKRKQMLNALHDKIASITIGDPACGSGNFLTEAYRQLRTIENRIIEDENGDQTVLSLDNPIRVSLDQLCGIEINDFAVAVAKTALWITEEQMLRKTQEILPTYSFDFLPLRNLSNIREGNALTTDWSEVFPSDLTYLVGNPPFLGARNQTKEQKAELLSVFDGAKNAGNIDYCGAWYMKAARFTQGKRTRCALVSTNSICQGEQVANLWKPLVDLGIHIDFAHTTFRWDNEAADKAHVFCIIVGFSREVSKKRLYMHESPDAPEDLRFPKNINAYLADAPDAFVWNRSTPICNVPKIGIGNKPIDGGFYLFSDDEMVDFLKAEPGAKQYFHKWIGAREFLHGESRWCLYLGNATFSDLKALPRCRERIESVREYRLASKSSPTRKLAETPARFHVENMPKGNSIVFPRHSSERRKYLPLGFIGPDILCGDANTMLPDATIYHFGVLHSQFHNAWIRTVAGRLKSDYRYSGGVVYNNFVWPEPTDAQRGEIERCAQAVLDARAAQEGATLSDMYDPNNETFFPDLMRAHRELDAAVEVAYGVDFDGDEERIVAHLFNLYAEKTAN
ncbi:DNA methyltransferase [Enorma massiliensis]|uniref:site-specific DNA-methyltransferase (adenine-specific) n=1 Tax=Enorma massiliensis TaxID=1472761 RepID=A0A1Y3TZC3_9ACTN|nr:DNA methyltransferase [Enorma massiliensis]OUN41791.1 SAM-dependent methyltransferase [Enorma massiliensis]